MPVRTLKSIKQIPKIKVCYLEAKSCLGNLDIQNIQPFLNKLHEVFLIQKPINILKDFFFLTYITALIHQSLTQKQASSKIGQIIQVLISLLRAHYKNEPVALNNSCIKLAQQIVLELRQDIQQNVDRKNSKALALSNLIQMIPRLNVDLICFALKKVEKMDKIRNFFTLFLDDISPYLPNVLTKPAFLVLDLDETLVHHSDNKFLIRPGCIEFIKRMSEDLELVLFTSAEECYANTALRIIDSERHVKFRLYRQHLVNDNGIMVKDLRVLGKSLSNVLIVDDRITNFRLQPQNAIKILPWTGDEKDRELIKLAQVLHYILRVSPHDMVNGLKLFRESMNTPTLV